MAEPAFWNDVIADAFMLDPLELDSSNQLMSDIEKLNRKQSENLSKKFSAIKSESVKLKYEYAPLNHKADENVDGEGPKVVLISG